ncbi:unnamed protein product, partial [Prorocentrum cordatum]
MSKPPRAHRGGGGHEVQVLTWPTRHPSRPRWPQERHSGHEYWSKGRYDRSSSRREARDGGQWRRGAPSPIRRRADRTAAGNRRGPPPRSRTRDPERQGSDRDSTPGRSPSPHADTQDVEVMYFKYAEAAFLFGSSKGAAVRHIAAASAADLKLSQNNRK